MAELLPGAWEGRTGIGLGRYRCGFCGERVAVEVGWHTETQGNVKYGRIRICSHCNQPTFFRLDGLQLPAATEAADVRHLPGDLGAIYEEARRARAANANTACVLALRKLLMHVAVEKGAKEGLSFIKYVEYLDSEHYLGKDGKGWVDRVRTKGNEATHEIVLMSEQDAEYLLTVAQMLLKLVYEFPGDLAADKTP